MVCVTVALKVRHKLSKYPLNIGPLAALERTGNDTDKWEITSQDACSTGQPLPARLGPLHRETARRPAGLYPAERKWRPGNGVGAAIVDRPPGPPVQRTSKQPEYLLHVPASPQLLVERNPCEETRGTPLEVARLTCRSQQADGTWMTDGRSPQRQISWPLQLGWGEGG